MRKLYRLSDLPVRDVPFQEVPLGRGHLDGLVPTEYGVRVNGWLAAPGNKVDEMEVHHDGKHVFNSPMVLRPDVKAAYPWLPHGESVGFDFALPLTAEQALRTTRLDLIVQQKALGAKGPRARMSQLVRRDLEAFPKAPVANMFRVSHQKDIHNFKVGGLKSLGDFLEPLARHGDITKVRRMLDWGCGVGRMGMYFLAAEDGPEYYGCDIDADAIQWARTNIESGTFAVLNPLPPAPYADNHFDLIVSYSVFTHLTREVQHAWLAELRRILAPGGLFIATTHGALAYQFAFGSLTKEFPKEGIDDSIKDQTLDGIAPREYYRATFQSADYTRREFGRYFQVLELLEQGATNLQDIVVLRKN